jgi:hypothetical protein
MRATRSPRQRTARYTPWYHLAKPRCVTTTQAGDQCTFSASFISANGRTDLAVCKVHADMIKADRSQKVKLKPLRAERVWI